MRAIRTVKRFFNATSQYQKKQDIHRHAADLIASWEASLEKEVPPEKRKFDVNLKPGPKIRKPRIIKVSKTFEEEPKTLSLKEKLFQWLSLK